MLKKYSKLDKQYLYLEKFAYQNFTWLTKTVATKTGKKHPILYVIAILALLMATAAFNIQF